MSEEHCVFTLFTGNQQASGNIVLIMFIKLMVHVFMCNLVSFLAELKDLKNNFIVLLEKAYCKAIYHFFYRLNDLIKRVDIN